MTTSSTQFGFSTPRASLLLVCTFFWPPVGGPNAFASPQTAVGDASTGSQTEICDTDYAGSVNRMNERSRRQEKESRTPEQQKIDSQLLYALYQARGESMARGTPAEPIPLRRDAKGRVLVDVRAIVTSTVLKRIAALGGKIISTSPRDHSVLAYLKLEKLETLARLDDVRFISPAPEATTQQ